MANWRTSANGGGTDGTGSRQASIAAVAGDCLVVFYAVSGVVAAPTLTDDQDGTYANVTGANLSWGGTAGFIACYVREQFVSSTATHVITAAGSNSAGELHISAWTGIAAPGTGAVRSVGGQSEQASGTTPAPTLAVAALAANATMAAVAGTDTTTTAPVGWTERLDTSQITPTTTLQTSTRDSGFTGTTITFGATQTGSYASFAVELISAVTVDLTAAVTGTSTVTALLNTLLDLTASVTGTSSAAGDLQSLVDLVASASGTSAASALVDIVLQLVANATGSTTVVADLEVLINLEAAITGSTSATADLQTLVTMAAAASGQSGGSAELNVLLNLVAEAIGTSDGTALMTDASAVARSFSGLRILVETYSTKLRATTI
jgi:hypothetical protein